MEEAHAAATLIGLRVHWEHDVCVLHVSGELDLCTSGLLDDALTALLGSENEAIVDLEGVTFADARGLNPILDARARGSAVWVRNLPRSVVRMIAVLPTLGASLGGRTELAPAANDW